MTKAKKRVAARKKSPKRGKASAEPTRKLAAKHAKPKKAMSKVQRAGMSAKKPSAKQKRPADIAERRQVAEIVETKTTIMDVIEEPAGGVVAVTEYASVRTTASIPPGAEPERGEAIGPNSPELKPRDAGRS